MATATLEELDENHPAMKFLAFNLISATSMIVMNADNDELLVKMIKKNSKPENFVDYVDPKYQLDVNSLHFYLNSILSLLNCFKLKRNSGVC